MKKKKSKFKKRRSISSEELFKKKKSMQLFRMHYLISQAFPNLEEQTKYIKALISGLEE